MKLRWIDSNGVSDRDLAELPALRQAHRRIPLARYSGVERRSRGDASRTSSAFIRWRSAKAGTATTFRESMCIRTTCSSSCTHLRSAHAATCTISSWTNSLAKTSWSPSTDRSSPKVPLEAALRETEAVAARMENGRLHPTSPFGLTYAIVSSIARREAEMVAEIAREVGLMEQRVMAEEDEKDPQKFLSQLFAARHELLTIKTMAAQGSEIYRRAIKLTTFAPPEGLELMKDVLDQYETVAHISDSQLVFLMGVTEFYRARTDTKMTIAAERLAVIAAVTLPITSLSSVLGMNVIVNESTHWVALSILLLIMLTISLILLRWAHKQGWW